MIIGSLVIGLFCAGCTEQTVTENQSSGPQQPSKGAISFVATPYGTELSSGNVMLLMLEKAGYTVDMKVADVGLSWQAVGDGNVDFFIGAWLPTCHGQYLDKFEDDLDFVRKSLIGTRCGLVVPSYVEIDSISDLNTNKEKFNSKIIGIEPGAGIMVGTEDAIDAYNLDFELQAGSEIGMLAALKDAIANNKWIVITGWSPHWMFMGWDLKYLDDPKNIYGGEEYIATFTKKGLKEENPEIYGILERFSWEPSDMESIMYDVQNGMTDKDAAQKWIDAHPEKIQEWLGTP